MLTVRPKHILSKSFVVEQAGVRLGEMRLALLGTSGEVLLAGQTRALWKRGLGWETFVLEQDGAVIAEADKPALRHRYPLRFGQVRCDVRRPSFFRRAYEVRCGGRQVGVVEPVRLLGRAARVDLPKEWPLGLQLFVYWLAVVAWQRRQSAAG